MTNLLKKAIKKTTELPYDEQNKIAQIILDEIEDEKKWSLQFKNTQEELLILAEKALNSKTINKL